MPRRELARIIGYGLATSFALVGALFLAVPADVLAEHYRRLVGHALAGAIRLEVERVGLDEIGAAWARPGKLVACP